MTKSAKGTVENPGRKIAQKSGLNREILSVGWGALLEMVAYKAEEAGREFIKVDPRRTSQKCSACGYISPGNRTSQAAFKCLSCNFECNADVNAARNILEAGLASRLEKRGADKQPQVTKL